MSYRLENAWIGWAGRRLISDFSWTVDDGKITVVAGPVGTGKSSLLRLLSGRLPAEMEAGGTWRWREEDLTEIWTRGEPPRQISWVPQIRNAPAGDFGGDVLPEVLGRIESAVACRPSTLLLDEPSRGMPEEEVDRLCDTLRTLASQGTAIVVVTHNVTFMRAIADDICLLCSGRCETATSARAFFENPPTERARELIRRGACSPSLPPPPTLPSHFTWILDEQLGAMARPGLMGDLDDELYALAARGVSLLLSVLERGFEVRRLRPYGIVGHHIPCKDMGVPSIRDGLQGCRVAMNALERGEKVAVHCRAGLGRTGTLLACMLVHMGRTSSEAIEEIRRISPRYIQSDAQLRFVEEIERELRA